MICGIDIDLLNFDENLFCADFPNTPRNDTIVSNQQANIYQHSQLISPTNIDCFHSNIGDSTLLCKYCFNPLAIYLINFDRAIKLCSNQNVSF